MGASAAGTVRPLVGRDEPRRRIAALLDGLSRGYGGALVISGEPGIGKTSLLEHAICKARDRTVLRAVGLESESHLPFVALGDALRPLLPLVTELPTPQAGALRTALALETAQRPAELFAVCMATLTLLTGAAERRPALLLVDDAHWLDPASAVAFSFAARRLANDPVAIVFTLREGPASPLDIRGLDRLLLAGLDSEECGRLVEHLRGGARVAPEVADQLWQATGGNPLALREVATRLDERQLGGDRPLPKPLPFGADLVQAFTDQLKPLPEATRAALLVLALAAVPEVPVLLSALDMLDLTPAVLDPADAAGLIVTDGDRVRFSHPLVRSAVETAASGWARRRAYDSLIASAEGDTALSYRAAAATGPDDKLADELEAAAQRMRDRSGLAAAARAMCRAAQLGTDPECRARRLLQAGSDALNASHLDDAIAWLDQARTLAGDTHTVADVDLIRGRALLTRGTPAIAQRVLTAAAETVEATDPGRAARLLCEAALPIFTEGRVRTAEESCHRAIQLAEAAADPAVLNHARVVLAQAQVLGGHVAAARESLGAAASTLDPVDDALVYCMLGACYCWLEQHGQAQHLLDQVIDAARRDGRLGTLGHALNYRSEVGRCVGDWAQAYADAEQALRLAREIRMPLTVGLSVVLLARLDAACGRADLVAERLDQAAQMSGPLGTGGLVMWEGGVRGLLHLAAGAPEQAVSALEPVRDFAYRHGIGNPNVILWGPDLVEAYWRCGRTGEAAARLDELDADAKATGLPTPRAAAERCHGMLAEGAAADAHFAAAAALHVSAPNPFEQARTALCQGEALRRRRRPVEARPLLREALATFRRLGAAPFARRASAELAAAGGRPPGAARDLSPMQHLTPQELQVAMAVARGLSNPAVAAALFISRKTVEAHLSSVYRKLQLSSRTQLVRYLTRAGIDPA